MLYILPHPEIHPSNPIPSTFTHRAVLPPAPIVISTAIYSRSTSFLSRIGPSVYSILITLLSVLWCYIHLWWYFLSSQGEFDPECRDCIGAEGWDRMWASLRQGSEKLLIAHPPSTLRVHIYPSHLMPFFYEEWKLSWFIQWQFFLTADPAWYLWLSEKVVSSSIRLLAGDACMHNNLSLGQETLHNALLTSLFAHFSFLISGTIF